MFQNELGESEGFYYDNFQSPGHESGAFSKIWIKYATGTCHNNI